MLTTEPVQPTAVITSEAPMSAAVSARSHSGSGV
eukprot:CAMPEP_0119393294 /NCGR_PEP_ID=MMETSP1334-20130426/124872_1 /TAXON_ID=127549 /ORGANISM="Calcidiscus leptoporus, Strain RCC1130" /LENGTH=33 /DNA_ID= /DNA_START= /DNA_END= /DNA_ORIENTATION=